MKRYNLKRSKLENCIDQKCPKSFRKQFNSSERQSAKKEVTNIQDALLEDKEIKIRDLHELHRALDRKLNNIAFKLAKTFHKLGVPKGNFREVYHWSNFHEEWDYSNMSEDEILEMLALTTKQDYVIDLNHAIKYANFTWWDDEYY